MSERTFWTHILHRQGILPFVRVPWTLKTNVSGVYTIPTRSTSCCCIFRSLVFGLECWVEPKMDPLFFRRLTTTKSTVTILCIPSLHIWNKMKLTRHTFSSMALRLLQRICLWHSWTTCLRTESFLKPFGLQDLLIFLRPFFLGRGREGGAMKNSLYFNNLHTNDLLKMAITENIRNVDRAILITVSHNTVRRVNNVWGLAGKHVNITCNFLSMNHML